MTAVRPMTVLQAKQEAARDPHTHRPYVARGLGDEFCIADGEPWPCLAYREAAKCRCSHIADQHYVDHSGKTVCRSAACGCAQLRLKESA